MAPSAIVKSVPRDKVKVMPVLARAGLPGERFDWLWSGLHEDHPGHLFALQLARGHVIGFAISEWGGTARAVSRRLLREVPFGELQRAAERSFEDVREARPTDPLDWLEQWRADAGPRPGRARYPRAPRSSTSSP